MVAPVRRAVPASGALAAAVCALCLLALAGRAAAARSAGRRPCEAYIACTNAYAATLGCGEGAPVAFYQVDSDRECGYSQIENNVDIQVEGGAHACVCLTSRQAAARAGGLPIHRANVR